MTIGTTKIGVQTFATDESIHPVKLATALEERGFASFFLAEHSHIPADRSSPYPLGGELPREYYRTLDPFAVLSAAAAVTERLLLGTSVVLLMQRDPIHTAKEVASLDYLSGGRAIFGIGAGWNREEMRNHGTDPRTRGALLDERMAAVIEIWTKEKAEYHGKYVDFDPIFAWPKPIQRPHPPVYVGGNSPAAIARARRFGGWMPNCVVKPELVAEQIAQIGSDVPVIANAVPPQRDLVDAYREAGVEGITFHLPQLQEADALRTLDEWAKLL